jgi:hypothetical protein
MSVLTVRFIVYHNGMRFLYAFSVCIFVAPFPKIQKTGLVNECINVWTDTLHLLAPDWGGLLWPRLYLLKRLMSLARKNSPELSIEDA